jgi:hypothetical protein
MVLRVLRRELLVPGGEPERPDLRPGRVEKLVLLDEQSLLVLGREVAPAGRQRERLLYTTTGPGAGRARAAATVPAMMSALSAGQE